MQYFCILFFVALSQGFVVEDTKVEKSELPIPSFTSLAALDPADAKLEWTAVTSDDPKDPVLGYKLKVWERPNEKVIKYEIVDGVKTLVETERLPEGPNDLTTTPKEYITAKTSYIVKNLKFGVLYEFRVRAFTKTQESGLSAPDSIILRPNKRSKDFYTTTKED